MPTATYALVLAVIFATITIAVPVVTAQTYTVIHNFTDQGDGGIPEAGLSLDRAGNLYGTTASGGTYDSGTVFKVSHSGSGWLTTPLFSFIPRDGYAPSARVIFGPDGSLYGTTQAGGQGGSCGAGDGCGTVFRLTPSPTACKSALCSWNETVLYRFRGGADGGVPASEVIFDQAGNLYGTTTVGGYTTLGCSAGCGVVYKLSPSNGGWSESVLYAFMGGADGYFPFSGLIFDPTGDLYGTTESGGSSNTGTVFELTPSGSGWTKNTIYSFEDNPGGIFPFGGPVFDSSGNLYGTTLEGGNSNCYEGCGTIFSLSPSNSGWVHTLLHEFSGAGDAFPRGSLIMDSAGNLYGTTSGELQTGNVFELAPSSGGWTYTSLHNFTGGSDGDNPWGQVTLDAHGNLYGTASGGGSYYFGAVWEITP